MQSRQKAWVTLLMKPTSPSAGSWRPSGPAWPQRSAVSPAALAGSASSGSSASISWRASALGSTSSICQPLLQPTSMYSMKRKANGRPRKWRTSGKIWCSLVPRLTTVLILIGPSPTASAASIPASTSATGKSASFMRLNTASSSASRLMVMRLRPAALRLRALRCSKLALVVRVRSSGRPSGVRSCASCSIRVSTFLRSSGSPPVRRSLRTPCATKSRASRVISSKLSRSACGKKAWWRSKVSRGMQ